MPGSGEHTLGHSEEWFRHFEVLTTLVARRLGRLQPRELSTLGSEECTEMGQPHQRDVDCLVMLIGVFGEPW